MTKISHKITRATFHTGVLMLGQVLTSIDAKKQAATMYRLADGSLYIESTNPQYVDKIVPPGNIISLDVERPSEE